MADAQMWSLAQHQPSASRWCSLMAGRRPPAALLGRVLPRTLLLHVPNGLTLSPLGSAA